jgi:UDP-N-acetylmuramoyl-tripeptide--D-alanyl-D-alanine ligase
MLDINLKSFLETYRNGKQIEENLITIQKISTNSKIVDRDTFFIPIVGEIHDAHKFIEPIQNKISGFVFSDYEQVKHIIENKDRDKLDLIQVDDTLHFLQELAAFYRKQWNGKVIGITGSSGKTSTKDLLAGILSSKYKVFKTQGNLNSQIGTALSLLSIEKDVDVAVLELGMSDFGEIKRLMEITKPDIGIIINVYSAHLESLKTLDNVALCKGEMAEYLENDKLLILNEDNSFVKEMKKRFNGRVQFYSTNKSSDLNIENFEEIFIDSNGIKFNVVHEDRVHELILKNSYNKYNVSNCLASCLAATEFGLSFNDIQNGLDRIEYTKMRMEKVEKSGLQFINDAYNSNPDSLKAAIDSFSSIDIQGNKYLVIGDMLELGEKKVLLHENISDYIIETKIYFTLTFGELSHKLCKQMERNKKQVRHFQTHEEIAKFIKKNVGPKDLVLLKGSRGMRMEKILDFI